MNVAVIDYGMGNVFNVERALKAIGCHVVITNDPIEIEAADAILLPGVGAFPQAMASLHATGLVPLLKQMATEKPFLGICLGMQLLFDSSTEGMLTKGLGLIEGRVERMRAKRLPHVGWNSILRDEDVYFVHSYHVVTDEANIVASADYMGERVPAIVQDGLVTGMQFHPEKSGTFGLRLLQEWKESVEREITTGN
ncbi:MAG: imidazole glycerol phosphate synthase subunit HisH [Exiguobacterium sp.]|uniref:imidazole glycerol phosphate synthase subunit HisH n=1 Tax=Exiguobacterium sp. AB2 TaxID=1484479 RepID=UPI0004A97376|nr:imidazole glycerol phosphate synthase subunit HisH [Exiguobacterium sp. AB2]KDN59263.1 imidazole glycerol phosphate synthase [Exiguobacterium sp. AB2]MDX5324436.1 imidazole glycerol phosphate synthase subunit HisH [Exiguobacterium sp.]MDX5426280.1 imidazole glycerol phosphate synthase subunit HisH [Exiguobacterium sp.]MDX6773653.1 imidazole glycerol phosphate synthase subunit HisH [Exiguobacterium sp.]